MVRTVGLAIDRKRTGPANALAAIGIECDRLLALCDKPFVHDIQHFEKRRIRRNVRGLVFDELPFALRVSLAPDLEFEIHESLKL